MKSNHEQSDNMNYKIDQAQIKLPLHLHPPHMPHPVSSQIIRHYTNKVDPDLFQIDFIFIHIEHDGSFHSSTFR